MRKNSRVHSLRSSTPLRLFLRQQFPPAEQLLWLYLKGKQLKNYKFRRQHSIGKYVVDFYCPSARLAIEIDGDSHFTPESQHYDQTRTNFLQTHGIRVLRFTNPDIYENLESVLDTISLYLP